MNPTNDKDTLSFLEKQRHHLDLCQSTLLDVSSEDYTLDTLEACLIVKDIIQNAPHLNYLSLSRSRLGKCSNGFLEIASAIAQSRSLQVVHLDFNMLSASQIEDFCGVMKTNKSVTSINLEGNYYHIDQLEKFLQKNRKIQTLFLGVIDSFIEENLNFNRRHSRDAARLEVLLLARHFQPNSVFFQEFLPLDVFRMLIHLSNLYLRDFPWEHRVGFEKEWEEGQSLSPYGGDDLCSLKKKIKYELW